MNKIMKEIASKENLEINLPQYGNNMMSIYNRFSYVRLAMNYYTYYEMIAESSTDDITEIKSLLFRLNNIIKDVILTGQVGIELENAVNDINDIRDKVIGTMKILTVYVDRFNIYEHVLNRVEHRFSGETLKGDYSDADTVAKILQYILNEKDNVVINSKIKSIVGQLPIRMTKGKFFELLQETIKLYKEADEKTLDDFVFMVRTGAMILVPDGFDKEFPDLLSIVSNLADADYSEITEDVYEDLHNKLLYGCDYIDRTVNYYMMLQELINDTYVILLSLPYAESKSAETTASVAIIKYLNEKFNSKTLVEITDEVDGYLFALEGQQEELHRRIGENEYLLETILTEDMEFVKSIMLEKIYNSLNVIKDLLSGSIFVEFGQEYSTEKVTKRLLDETYIKLESEFNKMFTNNGKLVNRAIMANVISEFPVFFNNVDEIKAYIENALSSCRDEAEKIACIQVIDQIIEED